MTKPNVRSKDKAADTFPSDNAVNIAEAKIFSILTAIIVPNDRGGSRNSQICKYDKNIVKEEIGDAP